VIEPLISIVVAFSPDSFEFEHGIAIFALGDNGLDISIFFVSGECEWTDPDCGLPPCVIFEHCEKDTNVVDLAILVFLNGEQETAHR
jgi:hypothetical protein